MNGINERLQAIVDKVFDGNKAKFAKAIDIAPTSISNYLSEKRQSKPSSDMLERIINVVDGLSAHWLLTGEGEMLRTPSVSQSANGNHNMQVAGNANNVHSSPDAARLLNLIESQQRTIERQAATIENLSRR